jgi:hypothetical protein
MLAAAIFGIGPALRAASASPSDAMVANGSRSHSASAARSRLLRAAAASLAAVALLALYPRRCAPLGWTQFNLFGPIEFHESFSRVSRTGRIGDTLTSDNNPLTVVGVE